MALCTRSVKKIRSGVNYDVFLIRIRLEHQTHYTYTQTAHFTVTVVVVIISSPSFYAALAGVFDCRYSGTFIFGFNVQSVQS